MSAAHRHSCTKSTSHRTWQRELLQAEPAALLLYNNITTCHDT